jgi:ABC-type glycerol-3-phosphate transport system substrate-binding protein
MRLFLSTLLLGIIIALGGSVLAQDATTSPTATEELAITLTIWWPDSLALSSENILNPLLLEQSEAFQENQTPPLSIEHRIKAVGTVGGIMSTLRNASNVAPNAMPSLTLLRRQDLLVAAREGLLQSLEGGIPSSIQGDLRAVLTLGQVNGELYGLPYLLDLQHLVYRPQSNVDYSDWSYAGVLEREQAFAFPASRTSGVNDVFLLQYLASGGSLSTNGSLSLNPSSLEKNLEFYQAAMERGIVDNLSLSYSSPNNYLADFQTGVYNMAVFSSSNYLQLHAAEPGLAIAPIPSETGKQTSILNGWIWVLVTDDARERMAALDYIAWMMDSNRQAAFAEASFNLPSRQSAMALGLAGDAPLDPFLLLLENPVLPLSDVEIGSLGSAMQTALSSVLNAESSAEEATQTLINQAPQ